MEDPRIEYTITHEKRKMEQYALSTEAKKRKYVHDVKSGLGELIKEEPNKPQKKVMWYHKLVKLLMNG
mgnify:FL=1|tara:strand:+ start:75 stop:278 length:204 start_codon:yes stop_codon:yes gene_type:complete